MLHARSVLGVVAAIPAGVVALLSASTAVYLLQVMSRSGALFAGHAS